MSDEHCMTGDGNQAVPPTALCRECLDRPNGAERPTADPEQCVQCWGSVEVWYGNTWGVQHLPPGLGACQHECHADEVWVGG